MKNKHDVRSFKSHSLHDITRSFLPPVSQYPTAPKPSVRSFSGDRNNQDVSLSRIFLDALDISMYRTVYILPLPKLRTLIFRPTRRGIHNHGYLLNLKSNQLWRLYWKVINMVALPRSSSPIIFSVQEIDADYLHFPQRLPVHRSRRPPSSSVTMTSKS